VKKLGREIEKEKWTGGRGVVGFAERIKIKELWAIRMKRLRRP